MTKKEAKVSLQLSDILHLLQTQNKLIFSDGQNQFEVRKLNKEEIINNICTCSDSGMTLEDKPA